MKIHSTLQFKLTSLLFVLGALLIGVSHYQHLIRDLRQHREAIRAEAYSMGARVSGMAQHTFWRGEFRTTDLEVSYASIVPELNLGLVCDGNGLVRNTTLQRWRNVAVEETPLAYAVPQVKRIREVLTGEVIDDLVKDHMLAIFPFRDGKNNHSTGVVLLDFDLTAPLASAHSAALNDTMSHGFALLAACLLLWLALHVLVTSRLNFVVHQATIAGAGSAEIASLPGNDEMASLSQAFVRAFQKLRDSEYQFRQFAESMKDVLWMAPSTPQGLPVVNSAYHNVLGLEPGELKSHRWGWLRRVALDDRKKVMRFLSKLRRTEEKGEMEFRLTLPDGETRWMQVRGFRLRTSGNGASVGGIAVDVTESRDVAKRLVEAAESERRRIGMDLHDDVCQRLAAAQLKCGVLEAMLKKEKNTHVQLAGSIVNEISLATDMARTFARGMAPVALNVGAFGPALDQVVTQIQKAFDVTCTASCDLPDGCMGDEMAAHMFRIAQELATNAAKHGHGKWVSIRCYVSPGNLGPMLRLEVANDGVPFNPGLNTSPGMGLHLIKQRADVVGATVSFHPRAQPDGGTVVICEVPLSL